MKVIFLYLIILIFSFVFNILKNVENIETELACGVCKLGYTLVRATVLSESELHFVAKEICVRFHIESYRVCEGLANIYEEELFFILRNTDLTSSEVCGILIGPKCIPKQSASSRTNWEIKLSDKSKKSGNSRKNESVMLMTEMNKSQVKLMGSQMGSEMGLNKAEVKLKTWNRILHLSDLHVDMFYDFGANSDCGEPLCCRVSSAKSKSGHKAGYWGDYLSCDSPQYTIVNMMRHINTTLSSQYDYIVWSGDSIAHDVWNYTKQSVINGSRLLTSLVKHYLSNEKLVFPVIGNHEGFPVDQFAPPEINGSLSSRWIYESLFEQWQDWIPSNQHDTFKRYGYYSRNISSTFKVIVMNTNYCHRLNFWQYYKPNDPGNQLKWLAEELDDAERDGQNVHIVGHIPIDSTQCTSSWVHNYIKILERYQSIIMAQFFGHTHFDEFRLFYSSESGSPDKNDTKPLSVAFLGPSITPYQLLNPAFRFYTLNENASVTDHSTYFLNLTAANIEGKVETPKWMKEYSAREAYQMKAFDAIQWNALYIRMLDSDDLFESYYQHYHRHSNAFPTQCDLSCKTQILSSVRIFDPMLT